MRTLRNRKGGGMLLLDAKLAKPIPGLMADEVTSASDPMAYVRFFTVSGWSWWLLALDRESLIGLCYVVSPGESICNGEIGTVDLSKLAELEVMRGLGVERDTSFEPSRLSVICGEEVKHAE